MSAKWLRVIAAATFLSTSGFLLSLAVTWPGFGATPQTAGQTPLPGSPSGQANQPPQAPPLRSPDQNTARKPYRPAAAVSAADMQFPLQTTADGLVIFSVSLGPSGEIRKISVLQDLPPFTPVAEQSLRSWKFAAASENGRPEDSEMLVAFVFRHAVYIANPPRFTPVVPAKESEETRRGFVPPGILSISYAAYPASTIASGAVVVQANVKPDGSTGGVSIVHDLPGGFGPLAINAAKHWRFQAASRDGLPVPSKVAMAFVFSSRSLNPF